jgi:hypothetical protein
MRPGFDASYSKSLSLIFLVMILAESHCNFMARIWNLSAYLEEIDYLDDLRR